ncbi:MAG TPA: HAMP domain-containing sensor histidine kinase [Anaerolineae bacterium]|nr:HAMP domain-containing sensor histidine kinase [Anaerolineae bacterium]
MTIRSHAVIIFEANLPDRPKMIATNSPSTSSNPIRYYAISLLFPLSILLALRAIPQIDLNLNSPTAHFYIVTAVSFIGIVLAGQAHTLARVSGRAQILFVSLGMFSVTGLLFIHGLATAGALLPEPTPGAGWSARLSLVVGGIFFVLSGTRWPASISLVLVKRYRSIIAAAWIIYAAFFLVVFSFPAQLAGLDKTGSTGVLITLIAAITLYSVALILSLNRSRVEHKRLDAFITIGLLLFGAAVASQSVGILWHLSWWSYHFLIGLAIIVMAVGLNHEYGHLRPANLQRTYFLFGLTVIALLALVASEIFFRINRDNLTHERETSAIVLAQHVAIELQSELPQITDPVGLQSLASIPQVKEIIDHNLVGLNIPRVKIYDAIGQIVYSTASFTLGQAQANDALLSAITGQPRSLLEDNTEPEVPGEPALAGQIIETYVPLRNANQEIIGAFEIYQDANDLIATAILQRGQFLITVSILMLLLFGGFVLIVRRADQLVTARTAELAATRFSLQQSERTRQDMTNVVISNVRRPMATLTRSIDQIQRGTLSPEQGELIGRARNNAREVNNTIYNLLNISQIENGELHLQQSTFPINDLLQVTVQQVAESARDAEVTVRSEVRPGLPYVWADRDLIGRVINNLLSNAIKHTRRGGRLLLNADVEPGGNIVVRVQDQGAGITVEDQAHLFDKFARIGGEATGDSTGLGLAFCKMTIEQHQGRLWVESTVGQGSTFAFTLPTLTTAAAI